MQISEHIYLVGSEQFGLSHPLDCSCYLIDGGSAVALIDAGLGLGVDDIIANIAAAGFDQRARDRAVVEQRPNLLAQAGAYQLVPARNISDREL